MGPVRTPRTAARRGGADGGRGQLRAGLIFLGSLFVPLLVSFGVHSAGRPARLIAVGTALLAADAAMREASRWPSSQGVLRPWSWWAYGLWLGVRLAILLAIVWPAPPSS